jgi:dTDP-4-amino-4,6-dideoxygalactose transaminase
MAVMTAPVTLVPQANPGAGYQALKPEIDAAVARALQSGWYILGAEGRAFEAEFAQWLGTSHAIGCGNGTDALALALRGLGVGAGKAVATVSHTAVATVAAIEMTGATPVLIDIDPVHYTMDPAELAVVLAHPPAGLPPIAAIIVVHLYGQPADLRPILALGARYGIPVIEDCSQAHGATLDGQKVGTFSEVSCFSLYPTKNLGALGDGGVVATSDAILAENIAALRQYGWKTHYISEAIGVNSRLDEIQAAILRVKLTHLDAQNARRQQIAAAYDSALTGTSTTPPSRRPGSTHVFHQYVLRTADRAAVQAQLRADGVATGVHYPVPVHLQSAYAGRVAMGPAGCAATALASAAVLSLPMFPQLTDAQVEQVSAALRKVF